MREIKFRAWDKIEKQMCPVTRVIFRQPTGYDFINVRIKWNGKIIDQGGFIGKDNTYILMQYIGAKDKNGVEIYEGDIIRSPAGKDYWIRWSELTYRFVAEPIPANRLEAQLVSRTISNYEVVGNIHESPEFANWEGTKID